MFIGVLLPSLFGAFTALTFANPTDSYIDDLVAASPAWYVLPIVVISLFGGMSQGELCVYASGLDLEGLAPRLKRTQTTVIPRPSPSPCCTSACSCSTPSTR